MARLQVRSRPQRAANGSKPGARPAARSPSTTVFAKGDAVTIEWPDGALWFAKVVATRKARGGVTKVHFKWAGRMPGPQRHRRSGSTQLSHRTVRPRPQLVRVAAALC